MNVFVIGIGLIGGSLAKDIKSAFDNVTVYGIESNASNLEEALSLGIINQKATYKDLQLADMVIVSIPVDVMVTELPKILDAVHEDCVVF
ncbi:MAG: prephenate dehydrogenase/arogenate dehydrogenase family protein, partial [Maribacter litoralis]|uniref:prephenate dehydrogenase/arogenate dehydrogenase family protein n=1 Tax=Maribacter litoralis TaxID=2059726 RepID=UPI00329860AD